MIDRNGFLATYRVWRRRWFYPLISLVVALSLCLTTPMPGRALDLIPFLIQGVQVFQLSNISPNQEVDLGKRINQQLVGSDVRLNRNSEINNYVKQVGQRLVPNSDRPNIPYTFQVVEDNSINAFATLGGYVYVNTGLLKTADNEAELASVLAHEIGHIGGKHVVKQMQQKALESGLLTAAGLDRNTAVNIGVQIARDLPRSRQNEYEADQRGLRTLTRTGYSQAAMVSFMKKLLGKSSTPTFLSTHPGTSDRIVALQRSINAQPSNGRYGLDNSSYKANIQALR
ncbi:M48 family metalloprotease [Nostocaceae cyanobacterium CENA369]|uniref:M48 family metalloprotease n=1 Tax=Dendronalium phyllosphericum CENA369 TaxID=1725256 RepID=A0A8J7I830_9NOST|nr:M48 family metalloprotease [Dendronalium phyllosphericum]MBH8577259.1 M48 family metalloprotease [Dendronalium phyllosphericum CENA369]